MPESETQVMNQAGEMLCPVCHQPVRPEFYFCPNCGKALRETPLSVSAKAQLGLYAHSIFLPMIMFISVSRWQGLRYFRSNDPQTRSIGMIAIALMAISTIITYWLAIVWTQSTIQASLNDIGNLGSLNGL